MEQIVEFLKKNGAGCLATVEDGRPRVRPFGFGYYEAGRFWFCTNNKKKVFAQLRKTPYAEYCVASPGFQQYLRLTGSVVFDATIPAKAKVLQAMPMVTSIYKTPENPIFEVFYIEKGEAILSWFPPSPSRPDHVVRF